MIPSHSLDLIGDRVSRETLERLSVFVTLFAKWSDRINLVAPSTKGALWDRHIVDSLQLSFLSRSSKSWVDFGSGAGFPGLVTAIVLAEAGGGWVYLIESNNKKAAFLRLALAETGARGSVHAIRIEDAPRLIQDIDFISARAVSDLQSLLEYALPWADKNADLKCLFHKGRDYRQEVAIANGRFTYDLLLHNSIVEKDSVVLEISQLKKITL